MKVLISAAAATVMFGAAPAFAQDIAPGAGFRVEARAGLDHVRVGVEGEHGSRSGFDYSMEAGYDLRAGGALVGVYAGIGDSTTKECTEVFGGDRACVRADRNINVGARIGARVGASSIVYAKGGYSNGRAHIRYSDPAAPANNFSIGDNADGWHLGAGVEYGLRGGVYVKAEYVYTNYSTDTDDLGFDSDLDRHQLLGGVGIRF